MFGWIVGLGLLGIVLYRLNALQPTVQDDQAILRASQDLLVFFNQNRGVTMSSANSKQNALIRAFQIAWSNKELPKLRIDGVWDSSTAYVFRQVTGYSPAPVQAQVTSGYYP